jgi:two-component system CheB/CheR fusion protein
MLSGVNPVTGDHVFSPADAAKLLDSRRLLKHSASAGIHLSQPTHSHGGENMMNVEGTIPSQADPVEPSDPSANAKCDVPFVVGIGASAGGLEPLEAFFRKMPPDSGMAFVVIQHLSPDHKSLMDELLARHTTMRILRVHDEMAVEPNTIYLIPPKKEMAIAGGKLRLVEQVRTGMVNLPIDIFFRTLAQDRRERGIAIVLSGSGRDGSRGIVDVSDVGGLSIAQTPESAAFDSMPKAAIDTGVVELVLDPKDMPAALMEYAADPTTRPGQRDAAVQETGTVEEVFGILREAHDIDFSHYKPGTVRRRIQRRLAVRHDRDMASYVQRLRRDDAEVMALCRDLLIGVTRFFRDPEAYEALAEHCIQELFDKKSPHESIRVWSSGCATGEEAYSLAMLFCETAEKLDQPCDVKIFATDVHRRSLELAGVGVYSEASLAELSPERRARFFVREGDGYRVSRELRQMIVFAPHNLLYDAPFTKMDLVCCRNLLIYFNSPAQERVISLFHFALRADGFLLLGPSESLNALADEFGAVDPHWNLFRKLRDVRLPTNLRLPTGVADPLAYGTSNGANFPSYDQDLRHVYDALLGEYIPAGILVDRQRKIIHTFGGVARLLRHPEGRSSQDVLDHVSADLRLILSAGLQRAFKGQSPVQFDAVRVSQPEGDEFYQIRVQTLGREGVDASKAFIALSRKAAPQASPPASDETPVTVQEISHDRIRTLEEELRNTKEHLQAVIEELETSNEELQATNEELVSSNEELQSTNEELHSVNEELHTVNAEYQQKIIELDELATDMDNLLASTEVGVVFVDEEKHVRKFTPSASLAFNLRQQDIGRPITDISNNIGVADLATLIDAVLDTGRPREREVVSAGGEILLMRVLPYTTAKATMRGVVLTFFDVTGVKHAEAALLESEERLRLIESLATDGMWDWNLETQEAYLSVRWKAQLGYEDHELANHTSTWQSLILPEDLGKKEKALDAHLREGKPFNVQVRFRHKNGSIVWLISRGQALKDETGRFTRMVGTHTDITEYKRAEIALVESEARFRRLAESMPEVFWICSLDGGRFVYTSPAYARVWGLGDQPPPRTPTEQFETVHPDDQDRVRQAFAKLIESGSFDQEYRIVRPDGTIRWIWDRAAVTHDDDGQPVWIAGLAADITTQKAQEERYRAVVEVVPTGLLNVDVEGKIVMANAASEQLFGYAREELVGSSIDRLIPSALVAAHRRHVREYFYRPAAQRMAPGRELNAVDRSGREFPVEIALSPVTLADGVFVLASITDITERKAAERMREKFTSDLKSRNQELDEFTYVASHDLQEPLRKMVAFSKLLASDMGEDLPERAATDLHHIKLSATRMQQLVQDLLALSRAGKSAMKLEQVPLATCVENALDAIKVRIDETQADITWDALPPVVADPTLLTQLLQNLLVNALKFTRPGHPPRVHIAARKTSEGIEVGVRDNGIGIKREYMDQLFTPFKRLHGREEYEGAGIGLAICRKVVERHGGMIWVESEPGAGAHFKFTLNAEEVAHAASRTSDQTGDRPAD